MKILPRLRDIHGWFDYAAVYDRMLSQSCDGQVFVEIGAWFGKASIYLALKAKECKKNIKIYSIDTWRGLSEHEQRRIITTGWMSQYNGDIYNQFIKNITDFGVSDVITPLRLEVETTSLDPISNLFAEHSIDFLFINQHDKFWLVADTLHVWHDKVKNGGYIGCRVGHEKVKSIVRELLGPTDFFRPQTCLYQKKQDRFCKPTQRDPYKIKLKIVNDEQLIDVGNNYVKYTVDKSQKLKHVMLAPFQTEHYNDIDLFKTKIYCERNDIEILVAGSLNYFPVHTRYSDNVFLTSDLNHLKNLYDPEISTLGMKNSYKPSLEFYETPINLHIIGPANGSEFWGETSEFQEIAAKTISDDEVVEYMLNKPLMIRRSSWDFFQSIKSELPKDIILCEIKQTCQNHIKILKENIAAFDMPIIGLDYVFQKDLVQKAQLHYLSLQILASLFLNWQIIAIGGSSRLFSMLPTKNLLLTTHDLYPKMHYIQRQLSDKTQIKIYNHSCQYCTIPICNVSPLSHSLVEHIASIKKIIWPTVEIER